MASPHLDWFSRPVGRRGLLLAGAGLVAAACTPSGPNTGSSSPQSPLVQPRTGQPLTVALPNSDLTIGKNRFVLALLDADNKPIPNAQTALKFFKIRSTTTAEYKGDGSTTYYTIGPGERGIYVARTDFDEA